MKAISLSTISLSTISLSTIYIGVFTCCLALFLSTNTLQAQQIIKGNVKIKEQKDILKYKDATRIEGKLIVKKTKLLKIIGFDSLIHVEELVIIDNDYLREIKGFGRLKQARIITIYNNYDIEFLPTFDSLLRVSEIDISRNERLVEVVGFNSVRSANLIRIGENEGLERVGGFKNLSETKDLYISKNPTLSRVEDFNSFEAGYIHVFENPSLSTLPKSLVD